MSHKKIELGIKGMHCRSCEILLERDISKIKGVETAKANFKRGLVEIQYRGDQPKEEIIRQTVENCGYELGHEDQKSFFSKDPVDYVELVTVASVLLLIYLVLKTFGIFDFNLDVGGTPSLSAVLLIGLTAGVSSCMALVGGLVLGISARHAERHPEATQRQKFKPHLFFNLGRLVSYALLGGVIGWAGSALSLSSTILGFLTILIGVVMLLLGLKLIEIFPRLNNQGLFLPKGLSRALGLHQEMKEYSHRGSFVTGALTFFLPCGFTQAMQLYAVSTGSFTQGATIMFFFALGTMPGLLGIGGLTSVIKGAFARYFFKLAGLVVIVLAWVNISSGYNLTGWTLPSFGRSASQNSSPAGSNWDYSNSSNPSSVGGDSGSGQVRLENGKQIVIMEQNRGGYEPNSFTIKKGVPVKWVINSTNSYTCASYLVVPSLNLSQALQSGENIIEFTPTETGYIRFTCSMGMYSGVFKIID